MSRHDDYLISGALRRVQVVTVKKKSPPKDSPQPMVKRAYARHGQRYGRYKKLGDAYQEALNHGWLPDPENEGVFIGYVNDGEKTYEQRLMAQELYGEWFLRVIDENDLIARGGPGSGHHGHRGRVGKIGGSEPGKGPPHIRPGAAAPRGFGRQAPSGRGGPAGTPGTAQVSIADVPAEDSATVAQYYHAQAQQSEPELTAMMETLVALSDGELAGLEHNVKTADALQDKIERDMEEKGISAQEAVSEINDRNRYTIVLPAEDFVEKVMQQQAELESQGWTKYDHKWKNFFGGGDTYDGYNTVMVNEAGQRFELQFHTEQTYEIKTRTHPLYERFQETTDQTVRLAVWRQMADEYATIERPEGWQNLPGKQVYQEEPE